jgi:hypothetical protein
MFCIINLIKTVAVEIISNNNSFISELLDAEPLIYTKNDIPKSTNKLTGIVNIKKETNSKLPKAQIKIELCNRITMKDTIMKEQRVNKNKIAKKKKSSAGPTSFSVSFKINNLVKLFKEIICFK